MSLTFPSAYEYGLKNVHSKENWLLQLFYDDEGAADFLGLAGKDIQVDSKQYYGVVTDWGEVSESINLAESTGATSDIVVECSNVLKTGKLSDILYSGTVEYLNRKVKVYSQINDDTTLSNCLQIFEGRLVKIDITDSTVILYIESKKPWNKVSAPQVVSPKGLHQPIVYGDFTEDTLAHEYNGKYYYPVPVERRIQSELGELVECVAPKSLAGGGALCYYDTVLDRFIPITTSTITKEWGDVDLIGGDAALTRTFRVRATATATGNDFTDPELSYDVDSNGEGNDGASSYAVYPSSGAEGAAAGATETYELVIDDIQGFTGKCTSVELYVDASVEITATTDAGDYVIIKNATLGDTTTIADRLGVAGTGTTRNQVSCDMTAEYQANNDQMPDEITLQFEITGGGGGSGVSGVGRIYDVYFEVEVELDWANSPDAAESSVEAIKYLYSSNDGLLQTYTDNDSGLADRVHEMYRDILKRFTDWDEDNDDMVGWTSLNTDRSTWTCRWWQLEPRSLRDILDMIQFEGCFIFLPRTEAVGGRWIHVENSYIAGDVTQTFDENDYQGELRVSTTDINEIVTKWILNGWRHPAGVGGTDQETYTNSTARTNWNIGSNENVVQYECEAIGGGTMYASGESNANDNMALYYNNILGEPKIVVSFDLINMAKSDIQVGDIIKMNDSDTDPFGDTWSTIYFMVTETRRSPGMVSVTAREVYNT
jgi:hypothetical protein